MEFVKLAIMLGICLIASFAIGEECPENRAFTHEIGTTCVADQPDRIVALEYSFIDHLAVLDAPITGYAKDAMPSYLDDAVMQSTIIGTRKEPDVEAIAALNPDLIVADVHRHSEIYDQLSKIAPTVVHNSLRGDYDDQLSSLRQLGDIVNNAEAAEQAISNFESDLAKAIDESQAANVMVGVYVPGKMWVHTDESFMGSLLERLHKKNVMSVREGATQYPLDLEGVASVNPEMIIVACNSEAQGSIDEILNSSVGQALTAIKNQKVYFVPRNLWSKGRGLIGLGLILDDINSMGILSNDASTKHQCIE